MFLKQSTSTAQNEVNELLVTYLTYRIKYWNEVWLPFFEFKAKLTTLQQLQYVAQFSYGPSFRTKRTLFDYFRRSFKSSSTEEFQK